MSLFKWLFPDKVDFKSQIDFPEVALEPFIDKNRHTLSLIPNWIDEDAFKKSWFDYGVPSFISGDINKPISRTLTYSDLLLYFSDKHFPHLNYFEIGVSVGKNFFQMINGHEKGTFTAFDIETINPVLENELELVETETWETPAGSIKKNESYLKKYRRNALDVRYLCGDVWDENSWAKLKGNKYNIVFSDALHTPKAILFEFEMLVKYDLLDEKFVIVWDDLVGKMQKSFFRIINKYKKNYPIHDIYLVNINGWIGEHEPPHTVGIISSFPL